MKSVPILFRALCCLTFLLPALTATQALGQDGITVQLPVVGVSIDANGVLTAKEFTDPGRQIEARNLAAAKNLNAEVQQKSSLRKISLKRLEAAVAKAISDGDPISEEMQVLAGLQKIQYIFILPESQDVVVAGPAEGWVEDLAGRKVGLRTGLPALLLEDLLVAIRTFGPLKNLNSWVGVSIDPTAQGIKQLKEFQKQIPSHIPINRREAVMNQMATGLRDSLGLAKIAIYGVPRQTHAAQVMVEADYRMKLMAIGLEPKPIKMTTFMDALRGAPRHVQRWWLTPDYKCIKNAADGLSVELVGRKVKLLTENIEYNNQAQIVQTKLKPSRAASTYASSFTNSYERLSQARPVYAQLRNVIDLFVAAAWMKKNDAFQKSGWTPKSFLDNQVIDIENHPDAKTAPCAANAVWKGNVLIAPSGGGVSIKVLRAFADENLIADKKNEVQKARDNIQIPADRWWWD